MHLKEHYEPPEVAFNAIPQAPQIHHDPTDTRDVPEKFIIETLDDSQDEMKMSEINGDAFEFSEPEDMEDFRKEVAKVVETIGENPDSTWNYLENQEIENFSSNLCADEASASISMPAKEEESEEEDEKPLVMLKKPARVKSQPAENDDKEEMELNEYLKKISSYRCNVENCNKTFNSRTALGYHLKTHNSERRFVCDQVREKFEIQAQVESSSSYLTLKLKVT